MSAHEIIAAFNGLGPVKFKPMRFVEFSALLMELKKARLEK